jgi:hypothetical protein
VEVAIQSRDNPHGIYGAQSGTGTDSLFLQVLWFSPANHYSTNDEYSFITACKMYDKSNQPAGLILQSPVSVEDFLLTQIWADLLLVLFVFLFVQCNGKLLNNSITDVIVSIPSRPKGPRFHWLLKD